MSNKSETLVRNLMARAHEAERVHLDSRSLAPIMREAAEELGRLQTELPRRRALPQAIADIYAILEPLAPSDRARVMTAIKALLAPDPLRPLRVDRETPGALHARDDAHHGAR